MPSSRRPRSSSNYHSPLRERQAAATRQVIVDAALGLFEAQGWTATTLPAIAATAGVSVDTIYATFGTKSALFLATVHVAIVGDDQDVAMADRADFARLGRGGRTERLRTGVRYTMDVYRRSVPILRALREAAASDAAARERCAQYDHDRHELIGAGMTLIVGRAASTELVDSVWALVSPEVHSHLIDGRGWTEQQVEDWFVDLTQVAITRS